MNIETKFAPHDTAWFLRNNKVVSARVERVTISSWVDSRFGRRTAESVVVEILRPGSGTDQLTVSAEDAHRSKEDLLASL